MNAGFPPSLSHTAARFGGIQPSRSAQAPRFGDDAGHDTAEFDRDSAPPPEKRRTRLGNLMTLYKEYVTGKHWIGDLIWGTAVGAIMAIGTPVIVMTAPPAIATMMAISLTFRTIAALAMDPNGDFMTRMMARAERRGK